MCLPARQPSKEDEGDSHKLKFLPKVAQEIIDEFALRYAVEPIFRMMVYVEYSMLCTCFSER